MGCCGGGRHRSMGYGHHSPREYSENDGYLHKTAMSRSNTQTPMEMLKERLAKGEITLNEYQEISQALSS